MGKAVVKEKTLSRLIVRTALITLAAILALCIAGGFIFLAAAPGRAAGTLYGLGMEKQAFRLYEKDFERDRNDINKLAALCDLSAELMEKDKSFAKSTYTYILLLRGDGRLGAYTAARNAVDVADAALADKPYMANYANFISTALVKAYILAGKREEAAAVVKSDFTDSFAAGVTAASDYGLAVSTLPNRSFAPLIEDAYAREGIERFGFVFTVSGGAVATPLYDAISSVAEKTREIMDANISSGNVSVIFNSSVYAVWLLYTASDMRIIFRDTKTFAETEGNAALKAYAEAEYGYWQDLYDFAVTGFKDFCGIYSAMV